MDYSAEYTLKIKLNKVFIPKGLSEKEMKEKIIELGQRQATKFLSGYLQDPDKKIIEEEITFQELK